MKITIKRNGTGTIKEFNNKAELLSFASSELIKRGVIENSTQEKIINEDESVTIGEIIENIDYQRIR